MANPIDRLPPQNLEAETALLGCLMLDKDAVIKVADQIVADDFYDSRHRLIFQAILGLYERSAPIDVLTISNLLEERNEIDRVGGAAYLASLVNSVPSSAHANHYASIVRKKGTLRRLIHSASEITNLAFSEEGDIDDILDNAEQKLFDISQQHLKQNFVPISSVLHESFERIDELHRSRGKLRGLPTGFVDLDKKLGGLQKSDLVILAARPSMGKTSLALDILRYVAVHTKTPVGIFSLEMSKDQLVDRLLSSESNVDLWKIRTGNLGDDDFVALGDAMGALSEAPIFIDDAAGGNIMEIRTKARRLQMENKLGLIIVDYLQLMAGRSQENRVQEVSEISRSLKILARELNVPVLALSQLSRGVENRPDKVPQLADLRESGSIEQDADVVMFIYREDMYKGKDSSRPNIAEIHIKKHRNGPTGQVDLYFDAQRTSFRNLDKSFDTSPETVMQTLQGLDEELAS
ncbi:MAG TPA: replicative DNA helicase [Candidatus Doudnabacteria bacterium]|nr:replicative DNA helicase [Candidatus Doudnabacteria bacterium]